MAQATTRGETKLAERKETKTKVYFRLAHPERLGGMRWVVVGTGKAGHVTLERAFSEDAGIIVEVFPPDSTPDLEEMPTVYFGWAYLQVKPTATAKVIGNEPVGEVCFVDM